MIIHYSSSKLEKQLTDLRLLKKYFSKDYERLKNRLSELLAANCLSEIPEVPPPRRHKLTNNRAGTWGIDYSKNHRIIIKPTGDYNIEDLTTITEITILTLEDYH